jgi:hypothetical protein
MYTRQMLLNTLVNLAQSQEINGPSLMFVQGEWSNRGAGSQFAQLLERRTVRRKVGGREQARDRQSVDCAGPRWRAERYKCNRGYSL